MGTFLFFILIIGIFVVLLAFALVGSLVSGVLRLFGFKGFNSFQSTGFNNASSDNSAEAEQTAPEGSVGYSKEGRKRLKNLRREAEDVDFVEEK